MPRFTLNHILVAVAVALVACGCGSEPQRTVETTAEPPPRSERIAAERPPESPSREPAGPIIDDPRFELRVRADGPFTAGEPGILRVQLQPRGAYEVEARYPYRVVFHPSDGLAVARDELTRSDATEITAEQATFEVEVTPARAGTFNCSVDIEFAVCSDNGCIPLERTLTVELTAS